jgi:hypothetical protein
MNKRNLAFESLERRELLDGDVSVYVRSGNLYVTGDDAANEVGVADVSEREGPGCWRVGPLDEDTRINGKHDFVLMRGVTKNVIVDLKGGNDRLLANGTGGTRSHNGMYVNMQDGDDEVVVEYLHLKRDLDIKTQRGNDRVFLWDFVVEGYVRIDTSHGDDRIMWLGSQQPIGKYVSINTGQGDDVVLSSINARGDLKVDTSDGNDRFENSGSEILGTATIKTGKGDDILGLESMNVRRSLNIDTIDGDDIVGLHLLDVSGSVKILTGSGKDGIGVAGATVGGSMTIDTGNAGGSNSGRGDVVGITDANIGGTLKVRTADGNDVIFIGDEEHLVAVLRQAFAKWFETLGHWIDGGPVTASQIIVDSGSGDDSVITQGLKGPRANINMGSGDDYFGWDEIELTLALTLDGGKGSDTLCQGRRVKLPPSSVIRNWEVYEQCREEHLLDSLFA